MKLLKWEKLLEYFLKEKPDMSVAKGKPWEVSEARRREHERWELEVERIERERQRLLKDVGHPIYPWPEGKLIPVDEIIKTKIAGRAPPESMPSHHYTYNLNDELEDVVMGRDVNGELDLTLRFVSKELIPAGAKHRYTVRFKGQLHTFRALLTQALEQLNNSL